MSVAASICHDCGSGDLVIVMTPPGSPHYAKSVCGECGRFLRWLPNPAGAVRPRVLRSPDDPIAVLRGSPGQVEAAKAIRRRLIAECTAEGDEQAATIIRAVEDATWFLGNRARGLVALRWPAPGQLVAGCVSVEGGRS